MDHIKIHLRNALIDSSTQSRAKWQGRMSGSQCIGVEFFAASSF